MPVHDWTLVDAGIFHDFHTVWLGLIRTALNKGLLPKGYYALAEQHAGQAMPDVLALHASPEPLAPPWLPPDTGGIAVAENPPKVQHKRTIEPAALARRRSLAIRHVSGHRLIALLEIVSPANKDRALNVAAFTEKIASALERGVHVLILDLLPPSRRDPHGMHGKILQRLERSKERYNLPEQTPLTLASYAAGPRIEVYAEHLAVGAVLPDMPLFLRPDRYVMVPLEATYQAAWEGVPEFWRDVLEGRTPEGF